MEKTSSRYGITHDSSSVPNCSNCDSMQLRGLRTCARLPFMPLIVILIILLLLFGGGGYYMGPGVGYYGGGGISVILLIIILFLLFGRGRR